MKKNDKPKKLTPTQKLHQKIAELEAEAILWRKRLYELEAVHQDSLKKAAAELAKAHGEIMAVKMDNTQELLQLRGENRLLRSIFIAFTRGRPLPIQTPRLTAQEILDTYFSRDRADDEL